jgi:uncharacterized protein YerC
VGIPAKPKQTLRVFILFSHESSLAAKSINMANKLKSMLQVRRILQLLSDGHSKREISCQTCASRNTIDSYEARFFQSGKGYNELLQLPDTELAWLV